MSGGLKEHETVFDWLGALVSSLFYARRMSIVLLGGERTGCHNDISFPFTEYIGYRLGHLSATACALYADRCIAQAGR